MPLAIDIPAIILVLLGVASLVLLFVIGCITWLFRKTLSRQNQEDQLLNKADDQQLRNEAILSREEKRQQRQDALLTQWEDLARRMDGLLKHLEAKKWPDSR